MAENPNVPETLSATYEDFRARRKSAKCFPSPRSPNLRLAERKPVYAPVSTAGADRQRVFGTFPQVRITRS